MGQSRQTFTDEFKVAAVGRLYKPGATQGGVSQAEGLATSRCETTSAGTNDATVSR
jgi:transposase